MEIMAIFSLVLTCFPAIVWCHARLMSPPSRSSMWRVGFHTRKNFNDNALYCGGMTIQWQKNGGKCGICGDSYDQPYPRDNEAGGKYGHGVISKKYLSGQVIDATVEVTTNHRGYFEFKLCPNNNPRKEATQDCLDKNVLEAHGAGTRYYIGDRGRGYITMKLQLPKGLTCSQCVFQWTYVAGNNWGRCEDGESRLGCGPQETFRGCADIAIEDSIDIYNINDVVKHAKPQFDDGHGGKGNLAYSKNATSPKNSDSSYEISGNTHKNTTKTYHVHNSSRQRGNYNFFLKSGDNIYSNPQRSENSFIKRLLSNHQNNQGSVNKTEYWKYDRRHFYQKLNHQTYHRNSSSAVDSLNKWPISNGHFVTRNRQQYANNWHNTGRTQKRSSQMHFLPLNTSSNEFSLSQGLNLIGRRYTDFWLL